MHFCFLPLEMKEDFGIDASPSVPSPEGSGQQGRFGGLENLSSFPQSSSDLGLWFLFLINRSYIILQSFSFIFVYDEFYCHAFVHYDVLNLNLLIN